MKILCTSLKDSIALNYILGVETYSFQSECYIPDLLLENTIAVVIDNDKAGITYGEKLKEKFNIKIITPINKDIFEDLKNEDLNKLKEHYGLCNI